MLLLNLVFKTYAVEVGEQLEVTQLIKLLVLSYLVIDIVVGPGHMIVVEVREGVEDRNFLKNSTLLIKFYRVFTLRGWLRSIASWSWAG